MPTTGLSARLTVYYDGQFWVGFFEHEDDAGLAIARHVFGPEPSLTEIAELVTRRSWSRLNFVMTGVSDAPVRRLATNPKRRQREAARDARATAPSTKAQDALKAALGEQKLERAAARRERLAEAAEDRWQQRVAKRKEKKRGH